MEAFERWNLTLSNELVTIPGRVLKPEIISSSTESFDSGNEADWTKKLRSFPMYACAEMKRWAIVTPASCNHEVNMFLNTLYRVCEGLRFRLPRPDM